MCCVYFFFEKYFTTFRRKGACVTSGGIFIDLSVLLRFIPSSGFFCTEIQERKEKKVSKKKRNEKNNKILKEQEKNFQKKVR